MLSRSLTQRCLRLCSRSGESDSRSQLGSATSRDGSSSTSTGGSSFPSSSEWRGSRSADILLVGGTEGEYYTRAPVRAANQALEHNSRGIVTHGRRLQDIWPSKSTTGETANQSPTAYLAQFLLRQVDG